METIAFESGDVAAVCAEMQRLVSRGDGLGWINIGPGLKQEQLDRLPAPTLIGRWFSGRGPLVPMATWTPPRAGSSPTSAVVGIEHGAGPKALDRLRDAGTALPAGWRKVQDHAKHGIVAEPAAEESHERVLRWLLTACQSLCATDIEDFWLAEVHRPN